MTKYLPLLALAALILALALLSFVTDRASAFEDRVKEVTIEVRGGNDWVTTGLSVTPNDRATITAEGEVCFASSRYYDPCVGPSGMAQDRYARLFHGDAEACDDPFTYANHAQLIGQLDGGYPYSFGIGESETFTGKRGTIMLRVNDCSLINNSGYFTVTVKVEYDVTD